MSRKSISRATKSPVQGRMRTWVPGQQPPQFSWLPCVCHSTYLWHAFTKLSCRVPVCSCFHCSGSEETRGALGSPVKTGKALKCCQSPRQPFCHYQDKNVSVSCLQLLFLSKSDFKQFDSSYKILQTGLNWAFLFLCSAVPLLVLYSSRGRGGCLHPAKTNWPWRDRGSVKHGLRHEFTLMTANIFNVFSGVLKVWFYAWNSPASIMDVGLK